jgi:septum formation protein
MKFILASASPRRKNLIQLLGISWDIWAADVDESSVNHNNPAVDVVETARIKAEAVADKAPQNSLIVGADTTVALDQQRLNKPRDITDAVQMLQQLRGRVHQVYTGIVVINNLTEQQITDVATVDVPMRKYTNAEVEKYVASGDPMDKAGAYAIQDPVFRPVVGLEGCYAGVMGLPLCHLTRALHQLGVDIPADVALVCQAAHHYDCPIHEIILGPFSKRDNR